MAKRGCAAEFFGGGACGAARRIAGDAASATMQARVWQMNLRVALREALQILCDTRGIGIFLRYMWITFWEPRHCSGVLRECLRAADWQTVANPKREKRDTMRCRSGGKNRVAG